MENAGPGSKIVFLPGQNIERTLRAIGRALQKQDKGGMFQGTNAPIMLFKACQTFTGLELQKVTDAAKREIATQA